jgi:hypothetical protein
MVQCSRLIIGSGIYARMTKQEKWDIQIETAVRGRFSSTPRKLELAMELWREFSQGGLANAHFVSEMAGGTEEQFRQRLWEMRLARHLRSLGHQIYPNHSGGPDFRLAVGDLTIWVEAISPTPGPDIPKEWTTFDYSRTEVSVGSVPNKEILLRWTAAFAEKHRKQLHYRQKGLIAAGDAFAIAIDGSQLSKFPHTYGISQKPLALEAVCGVGPIAIPVEPTTAKLGEPFQTSELESENRNKSLVQRGCFYDTQFSGVSAVLGAHCSLEGEPVAPVHVVHNPLAIVPVSPGILSDGSDEWEARCLENDPVAGQLWEISRCS